MKKILSLLVAIIMCVGMVVPAMAAPNTASTEAIIDVLRFVEPQKDTYGLGDVDFEDLTIGNEISLYEYLPTGLQKDGVVYPLYDNGQIVALAVEVESEKYQITTSLVDELNNVSLGVVALLYDANSCRAFNGSNFVTIATFDNIDTRATLPENTELIDTVELVASSPNTEVPLNYSKAKERVDGYVYCPVPTVLQGSNNNICWAACVACIVNCLNGTSFTALDIAKEKYGDSDYNKTANLQDVINILKKHQVTYSYKGIVPSDEVMINNISTGYPIFGSFESVNAAIGHAAVIYGINSVAGYLSIMDPAGGTSSAALTTGGIYSYKSITSKNVFYLRSGLCHKW